MLQLAFSDLIVITDVRTDGRMDGWIKSSVEVTWYLQIRFFCYILFLLLVLKNTDILF